MFAYGLWIDGGQLSSRPGGRSLHPIVLLPFGLPSKDAVAHRSLRLLGYISDGADYLEAAYALGTNETELIF